MPYYIRNNWTLAVRNAWALDGNEKNPTLLGSTQLLTLQKFAHTPPEKRRQYVHLEDAGRAAMAAARTAARTAATASPATPRQSKASKIQKKLGESLPTLAGGLRIMEDTSPKKKQRNSLMSTSAAGRKLPGMRTTLSASPLGSRTSKQIDEISSSDANESSGSFDLKKDLEESIQESDQLSPGFLDDSATILSTASSKLSYLVTQVLKHYTSEKIIIFYETDNVAYYTAQALEALKIEHLIYAKSLSSERRSQYIVTFNQNPAFRVLLMDISQAAFGLDISAASRVYFINPPINKQVEAQAVK